MAASALTDAIAAHIERLQAKVKETKASCEAEVVRLQADITAAKQALALAKTTPDLEAVLKYCRQAGMLS